jgi:hypothetical protein
MRRRCVLVLRLLTGVLAGGLTVGLTVGLAGPASAAPATDHEVPFPCRQEWYGSTRSSHSPSVYSVDWNRTDDVYDPVVASGAGVVSRVENLGGSSYGLFVFLDHGSGESTVYAHLAAEYVTLGQRVDQGDLIGLLGTSGNSTGPHLHYEQRLDGRDQPAWFHDEALHMPAWVTSRNCVDTPLAGDWNGDDVAQIGLFRRSRTPTFRLAWGADVHKVAFGGPTDTPLVGDWDGDRVSDQGVRVGGSSTFLMRAGDGSTRSIDYGFASDRAVVGDWDGDGDSEIGLWRPSEATFYLRRADGSDKTVRLGSVGSLPVTGDWDGDGRTDVGTFASGRWTLQVLRGRRLGWVGVVGFGGSSDLPLVGDWNGDGATDLGTWTPSSALFTLREAAPQSLAAGARLTRTWGRAR